jgi:hypothetical protein
MASDVINALEKDQYVFLEYTLAKFRSLLKRYVQTRASAGFDMDTMKVQMKLHKDIIGE